MLTRCNLPLRPAAVLLAAMVLAALSPALAGPAPARSDAPSRGEVINGEERARRLEEIRRRQSGISAFSARVVQRKSHPLLEHEVSGQGTLRYRKPNLMRWELSGPVRMVVVMDGKSMTSYFPDRKEAYRRSLGDDMATQAAMEFLAAGMSASFGELEKRFRVDVLREDDGVVLRLSPRSRWLARAVSSIDIHHGSGDAVPRRIVVAGARGDRTEIRLLDVMINPSFSGDVFVLDLGPEVRITETGRPGGGVDDGA